MSGRAVGLPRNAFVAVIALVAACASAAEPATTGVVLLHGWGLQSEPSRANPFAHNWLVSKRLREAGYLVAEEEMAWGPNRLLDVPRGAAMVEIERLVAGLRASGASRIVVAGHSMGASMAFAYAAQGPAVDGIVAMAPGHHPELQARFFPEVLPRELRKAKRAIEDGRGDQPIAFTAVNCCFYFREFTTTPASFLSYYDPDGPATMEASVRRTRPGTHVLLAYGTADVIFDVFARAGLSYADYIVDRLPAGVARERVLVDAPHGGVPTAVVPHVMRWLAALPE